MRGLVLGLLMVVGAGACSMYRFPRIWAKAPGSKSKLFAFEEGGLTGFIDGTGRVVVRAVLPAGSQDVGDFSDGLVRAGNQFFNEAGVRVFSVAGEARDFSGGRARVFYERGGLPEFVGRDGKARLRIQGTDVGDFSEGLAQFTERPTKPPQQRIAVGKAGFLDVEGKVAIPASFADEGPFRNGLARVAADGYCHVLTPWGTKEPTPTTGSTSDCGGGGAPFYAVKACAVGFIDRTGRYAIAAQFESARDFAEGLAAVRVQGKWGFVDSKGRMVIAAGFDAAHSFSEGLAAVMVGGKWGFVDKTGRVVIAATMGEEPGDFSEGRAVVGGSRKLSYIDQQGRVALAGPYLEATPFVQGLAAVRVSKEEVAYITPAGKAVFWYKPRWL